MTSDKTEISKGVGCESEEMHRNSNSDLFSTFTVAFEWHILQGSEEH